MRWWQLLLEKFRAAITVSVRFTISPSSSVDLRRMSNSKFKSIFSPGTRSPERVISPDLRDAIEKEISDKAKDTVYAELKEAVVKLASNSMKFFNNFSVCNQQKWDDSNSFLRNLPPSLDMKLIIGLPAPEHYDAAMNDFLALLNTVSQIIKILDQVDQKHPHLIEGDRLFDLSVRATLLLEIHHKYSRYFYQQIKEAKDRNEKLTRLKEVESELFLIHFPKSLVTLALDNKMNPTVAKQQQLKSQMSAFFEVFDSLNNEYREIQRDIFNSYSNYVHYGPEVLPSESEVFNDRRVYFRKNAFEVVRQSVRDLMTTVRSNYDSLVRQRGEDGQVVTNSDKLEDHLQYLLNRVNELGVEALRPTRVQDLTESVENLTVADESLLSYQGLVSRQIDDLQSAHLRHLFCYEDKEVSREDLVATELFLDSLFALENVAKLGYDQSVAAEKAIQHYLSNSGLNHNYKSVSQLLDQISSLKQLWSVAQGTVEKSKLLLASYQKKSSKDVQNRSVLARCSLPQFPQKANDPLLYASWRHEWLSLIESCGDVGQKLRLLRQSLENHAFAKSLVRFSKTLSHAMEKLDGEFQQKSSLGVRICNAVHSIPLAGDSLIQESKNVRRFLELLNQLDFNAIPAPTQLGISSILHVCNSLTPFREAEYISRRTSHGHDQWPIEDQFVDFVEYCESLVKMNTAIVQARNLRQVLEKPAIGKDGSTGKPKFRDLPSKKPEQRGLTSQAQTFEKKKSNTSGVGGSGRNGQKVVPVAKGKENRSCAFCSGRDHNQFGKCPEIMSRLLDQSGLLNELSRRGLCPSCLHRKENGVGDGKNKTHVCRDSFKIRDKSGKELVKSALCDKMCRGPGNQRLHARICPHAAEVYRDSLKTLQNKMMSMRPKLQSRANCMSVQSSKSTKVAGSCSNNVGATIPGLSGNGTLGALEGGRWAGEPTNDAKRVNVGNQIVNAELMLEVHPEEEIDGPSRVHLINGNVIGKCIRLSEPVGLANDARERTVHFLWDSGSSNCVSAPQEADLATQSWVLPEEFSLVTQMGRENIHLIRDQFRTTNGFCFQTVRLPNFEEEDSFEIIEISPHFQQKYGMDPFYSVKVSGHSVVAGQDIIGSFPIIQEIDNTGLGVFKSGISGKFYPFTTGIESQYVEEVSLEVPPVVVER